MFHDEAVAGDVVRRGCCAGVRGIDEESEWEPRDGGTTEGHRGGCAAGGHGRDLRGVDVNTHALSEAAVDKREPARRVGNVDSVRVVFAGVRAAARHGDRDCGRGGESEE